MKINLTLLFLLFCFLGNSQSVKVTYLEKSINYQERLDRMPDNVREATLAEMKIPKLFILEYSEGVSFYQREKNAKDFEYTAKSTTIDENGEMVKNTIIADRKITPFFYYKEFENNLMLFKLTNANINFDGKDALINWNWEITQETKNIKGYKCKKAISKNFNSLVTAWFTEEIPIKAGPEKYDGLPGLILYLTNLGQEFRAENIEILKNETTVARPEQPLRTVTFLEMFHQSSKKFEENLKLRKKNDDGIFSRTETY